MTSYRPKNGSESATVEIPYIEWTQHREEAKKAMAQVDALSRNMDRVVQHVSCLPKIENILTEAVEILKEMRTELLSSATNKDHVPLKVFLSVIGVISAGFFFALAIASGRSLSSPWMSVPVPVQVQPVTPAVPENN